MFIVTQFTLMAFEAGNNIDALTNIDFSVYVIFNYINTANTAPPTGASSTIAELATVYNLIYTKRPAYAGPTFCSAANASSISYSFWPIIGIAHSAGTFNLNRSASPYLRYNVL